MIRDSNDARSFMLPQMICPALVGDTWHLWALTQEGANSANPSGARRAAATFIAGRKRTWKVGSALLKYFERPEKLFVQVTAAG
jgi:hypothetical protein